MAAAPPKILPAVLTQGFIQAYYGEMAQMDPEAIYAQLAKLFGSKNPLLIVRQGEELRSKEEIIAKFQRIQSRGSIFVECLGFNGDYLSLSGHSSGEPSPFHLVTWGTMKIGTQPAVPFTESFVLSGSRSGSSYAYSINRSVLVFPTLTTDIDEYNTESPTAVPADASPSGFQNDSPHDWELVSSTSTVETASNPSSDPAAAPPPSNRSRDREPNKARTPRKTQDSSDALAVAAEASADAAAKEKQDKQSAPTSYASAARMVPSAPKDEARYPVSRPAAPGGSAAAPAARAPAAAAAPAKEAPEELPNGIIVKKIPDGFRLTQEFAQALLPNKKVAHVHAIPDKSHGFVYLVNEEDVRQLNLPSPVTFSFQGTTISVSLDRKKPKSSGPLARSGDTPRGRSQPHTDGFTQVAPRSRGRSDGHADGDDGARRMQGGRATGGGRGGAKPQGH